jgi:large subunit ribosomal protein L10
MARTQPKPQKVAEVEALEKSLSASSIVILTDYRGLTVTEIGTLRTRLREASLEYRVAKNTLLNRAAEQAGVAGLAPFLSGPTAVIFGKDDPGVPARLLQEFIRQYRKLEIKGGVVEGQALNPAGVQSLATLPTRMELLARVVGAIQGPLRALATVLSGPARGLVTALEAVRKQREEAGEPAPAAATGAAPTAPEEPKPAAGVEAPVESQTAVEAAAPEAAAVEAGPEASGITSDAIPAESQTPTEASVESQPRVPPSAEVQPEPAVEEREDVAQAGLEPATAPADEIHSPVVKADSETGSGDGDSSAPGGVREGES